MGNYVKAYKVTKNNVKIAKLPANVKQIHIHIFPIQKLTNLCEKVRLRTCMKD